MLGKLKHTLKHSAVYSLGNLSIKIVVLILLPLYTAKLSTGEYGTLYLLTITDTFLIAICSFKTNSALLRWWNDTETAKQKKIAFEVLIFIIVSIIFFKFKNNLRCKIVFCIFNNLTKTYNKIIEKTAKNFNAYYLNFDNLSIEKYFPDGIHYNSEGHKYVAQKIFEIVT